MRVAIDARELCGRPTGVGRYLTGLLDAWSASDRARRHQWTLIAHAPIEGAGRWPASLTTIPGSGGTSWEQFALPSAVRANGADVLFAPGYTAPLTVATPLVLTIHDVSFFAHPEWFSFREGTRRRILTAWAARRARTVITDSEFSRAEIERFIGVHNVRTIPLGLTRPDTRSEPRSGIGPMVLYVGSVFERRRVHRLIEAFDHIVAQVPDATLEIVGENRARGVDLEALRKRSAHSGRINIRAYVDEDTLARLYREASVFAFLSEYEGFGLTPLEALAEGVPPVVLDTAIARETNGDAAVYVSPDAGNEEIATAIANLLTRPAERRAILDRAGAVLDRYDWNRAADATLTVLEEAAIGR
jgi:glycosyltransferase involved in cell wall biosynthesis